MRREVAARLWDAVQAGQAITDFVAERTARDLSGDLMLRSAVERQLEILGEALGRLRTDDPETARQVPDLARIVGMRNVIAHQYGDVDGEILWVAVTRRVPELLSVLRSLLQEADSTT